MINCVESRAGENPAIRVSGDFHCVQHTMDITLSGVRCDCGFSSPLREPDSGKDGIAHWAMWINSIHHSPPLEKAAT